MKDTSADGEHLAANNNGHRSSLPLALIDLTAEEYGNGNSGEQRHYGRRRTDRGAPSISTSVVIPARNEARNLGWVLDNLPEWVNEVILVDGHSTDATIEMARACRPDIRIVFEGRPGKGAALRAGFEAATGDAIVMLDADGSMSPTELPRFVHFLEQGYDFVKGSRFVAGGGSFDITPFRRLGNRGLMTLMSALYRERITDLCYGFIAFHRRYLPFLALQTDGFEIETEMVLRAIKMGLRMAEVPSLELPRRSGRSNLHAVGDGLRVLRTAIGERSHR